MKVIDSAKEARLPLEEVAWCLHKVWNKGDERASPSMVLDLALAVLKEEVHQPNCDTKLDDLENNRCVFFALSTAQTCPNIPVRDPVLKIVRCHDHREVYDRGRQLTG